IASSPSPASPTTAISFSSSMIRLKPRRTRLWSSTSRTEILAAVGIASLSWNPQTDQRPTLSRVKKLEAPAQQFGPFAHSYHANSFSWLRGLRHDSFSVVFYFQL